jgi:hypothetical protein
LTSQAHYFRADHSAADKRIGWIEDDFVGGRKAGSDLDGIAEVMADGHWHELHVVVAYDTHAKAFGTEQQRV